MCKGISVTSNETWGMCEWIVSQGKRKVGDAEVDHEAAKPRKRGDVEVSSETGKRNPRKCVNGKIGDCEGLNTSMMHPPFWPQP